MEKDKESPFPREPWQRLLQDRPDAPPETTDARIRAAARKAVAPRAARWWLPASLAASFLIAVLIVQSQYGKDEKPAVVTESDLAVPATPAPAATGASSERAREAAEESATKARKESAPPESQDETAESAFAPEPEARVGGPEQELKAASEPEAAAIEQAAAPPETGFASGAALPRAASTPVDSAPADAARESTAVTSVAPAAARPRTPEAWYADIEALRKAGRTAEADAELARFEAAYPDWIKQHGRRKP